MDRKTFLSMAPLAGAMTLCNCGASGSEEPSEAPSAGRDYYELRSYLVENETQVAAIRDFLANAAIPALNRIGIESVGVFQPLEGLSPVYVLIPHRSAESVVTANARLLGDAAFLSAAASFLDAPPESPVFTRIESSLLAAFSGMPRMEKPVAGTSRIFQLRTYESASVVRGQKKITMFNTGEIPIFRKTGLNPVFFGEALAGTKMPQLTYMVGFENMEAQVANWAAFQADPDWLVLRAVPEYAGVVSNITNTLLKPLDCSQI